MTESNVTIKETTTLKHIKKKENFYRLHTETNLLRPFIDLHRFRTNYNFYVFDLSKQNDHIVSQPVRLEFIFSGAIDVTDFIA